VIAPLPAREQNDLVTQEQLGIVIAQLLHERRNDILIEKRIDRRRFTRHTVLVTVTSIIIWVVARDVMALIGSIGPSVTVEVFDLQRRLL
jgi:hypothetical protein